MKNRNLLLIVSALALSATGYGAGAKTGLVFSADVGGAMPTGALKADTNDASGATNASADNGNIAFGLAGGYDIALNKMFSVGAELGLQYANQVSRLSGSNDTDSASVKVSVMSIPLFATTKFYIPHTNGLNIFAKAGYAFNRLFAKDSASGDGLSVSQTDTLNLWRPVVAGGVGYQIMNDFNVFAQYQYNWLPYQGQNAGLSTVSAGLSYTLPM
ncbi:MAG: outer membrane protein [Francisellaceae bacterium]